MKTRRQLLTALPAAGALFAASTYTARGDVPALTKEARDKMTPDEILKSLKQGNTRFVNDKMLERDLMAQVKSTSTGQFPSAVVLGCIDSRVPPEFIFDQGIGDIFSPRIAGNFANTDIIGSCEFATLLAGAKVIVVLGHTECGAVKGACDNAQLGNLTTTLSKILPAVYSVQDVKGERNSKNKAFVQAVAEQNVRLTTEVLTNRSAVLRDLVEKKKLKVVGAMHDVGTGKVSWLA